MLPSNSIFLMFFTTACGKPRAASRSGAVCRGEEGRSQRRCNPAHNPLREGEPGRSPANRSVSADQAGKMGGRGGGPWPRGSAGHGARDPPGGEGALPAAASTSGGQPRPVSVSRVRVRLPLLMGGCGGGGDPASETEPRGPQRQVQPF